MGVRPSGGAVAGIGTMAGRNQNRPSNRHGYCSSRPFSSLLVSGAAAAKSEAKGFVNVGGVENATLPPSRAANIIQWACACPTDRDAADGCASLTETRKCPENSPCERVL